MLYLIRLFNRIFRDKRPQKEIELDNEYFPVQSDSEIAAGHPIVGAS